MLFKKVIPTLVFPKIIPTNHCLHKHPITSSVSLTKHHLLIATVVFTIIIHSHPNSSQTTHPNSCFLYNDSFLIQTRFLQKFFSKSSFQSKMLFSTLKSLLHPKKIMSYRLNPCLLFSTRKCFSIGNISPLKDITLFFPEENCSCPNSFLKNMRS